MLVDPHQLGVHGELYRLRINTSFRLFSDNDVIIVSRASPVSLCSHASRDSSCSWLRVFPIEGVLSSEYTSR